MSSTLALNRIWVSRQDLVRRGIASKSQSQNSDLELSIWMCSLRLPAHLPSTISSRHTNFGTGKKLSSLLYNLTSIIGQGDRGEESWWGIKGYNGTLEIRSLSLKNRDWPHTLDPPKLYLLDTKLEDFFIETKFLTMLYHSEQDRSHGSHFSEKSLLEPRALD